MVRCSCRCVYNCHLLNFLCTRYEKCWLKNEKENGWAWYLIGLGLFVLKNFFQRFTIGLAQNFILGLGSVGLKKIFLGFTIGLAHYFILSLESVRLKKIHRFTIGRVQCFILGLGSVGPKIFFFKGLHLTELSTLY